MRRGKNACVMSFLFWLGGSIAAWCFMTWYGFTEFPMREIGAALWPVLPIVGFAIRKGE